MTDFAKEARDLAPHIVEGDDCPIRDDSGLLISWEFVPDAVRLERLTEFARRMHAAGRAEGLARAAEIADRIIRAPNAGLVPPDGGDPTPREMLNNVADDIAEAILSASPPDLKEE